MKATGATDKAGLNTPPDDQPHVKNVRLVADTSSQGGAAGFDMRLAWVPAIAVLIVLYATITLFFD